MRSWLDRLFRPDPVPEGSPASGQRVYRLSSNLAGACFSATIQARWRPGDPDLDAVVFQHLRDLGSKVASSYSVLDAPAAQDAINASLTRRRGIPEAGVQWAAGRVTLDVARDCLDFAERTAALDRQAALDAADLEATQARLTKLRDLFLNDGAMARLWWSNGDPDRLLRLAEQAAPFDRVLAMVTRSRPNAAEVDRIATLIERFLVDLGPGHRELLIAQLAKVFDGYQRPELAAEISPAA